MIRIIIIVVFFIILIFFGDLLLLIVICNFFFLKILNIKIVFDDNIFNKKVFYFSFLKK